MKVRNLITILFSMVLCFAAFSSFNVCVAESSVKTQSSLTITYKNGDECCSGILVKAYRIAEMSEDGKYNICEKFSGYPVSIQDAASSTEWKNLADTLTEYIVADNIASDKKAETDSKGVVVFNNTEPGVYLTLSVKYKNESEMVIFEELLLQTPKQNSDGTYSYDIAAFPKCEIIKTSQEKAEYKVVKQWRDKGHSDERPENVRVDILKDGEIQEKQFLSSKNKWSYTWESVKDGSEWTVVERDVPKDYKVSISKKGKTIIITNTYKDSKDSVPKTGDTTILWPYILVACVSGFMLIILALWKKRSER